MIPPTEKTVATPLVLRGGGKTLRGLDNFYTSPVHVYMYMYVYMYM